MPRKKKKSASSHIPLKPVPYLMLVILAENDMHAYGLKKEILHRTDGKVQLGPGSLHRAIKVLEDDGLIEESDFRPPPGFDDPRRRYYRVTRRGRQVAVAETSRLEEVLANARSHLGMERS